MTSTPGQRSDPVTVLAIAILGYTLALVVHEGFGHGLACLAVGGTLKGVSSSWCDCRVDAVSVWAGSVEHAAGTIANLLLAVLAFGLQRALTRTSGAMQYFLWLCVAVNALMAGGYLMIDPIFGFGDWAAFLHGLAGWTWPVRILFIALGLTLTMAAFRHAGRTLTAFVGTSPEHALPAARLLCWLPWVGAGGLILTGAAVLNSYGPRYALTSALATLGGTWMLVWIPSTFSKPRPNLEEPSLSIDRSSGFVAGGMAALAFLLTIFGPGVIAS